MILCNNYNIILYIILGDNDKIIILTINFPQGFTLTYHTTNLNLMTKCWLT